MLYGSVKPKLPMYMFQLRLYPTGGAREDGRSAHQHRKGQR